MSTFSEQISSNKAVIRFDVVGGPERTAVAEDMSFLNYRLGSVEVSHEITKEQPDIIWYYDEAVKSIRYENEQLILTSFWEEGELNKIMVTMLANQMDKEGLHPFHSSSVVYRGHGILLVGGSPGDIALAAVWLFFIVMGPGVASPVYKLMYLGGGTREINEGVVRIDRIFDRRPVPEPAEPRVPTTYDIEFRHVGFSYSNEAEATRTEALRDISFTARQGEITALVGPSGSGKSTVANLIPRFWDVGQGEIRIGGIDIREIATERLMDIVSFVFQETFLFYDTLYENIRTGRPDATHEEVVAAAKAAQCHEFIERLPDGYATRIGDRGVYLSGGEAQRVCVARAILKNAPVLVLDEATAFADPENEWKMQQALQHLIRDKTVIIIAHRLSSIVAAQQILVLRQGQLVQSGRHEVLSKTDGVYKKMWDAYTDAFRWQLDTKEKRA